MARLTVPINFMLTPEIKGRLDDIRDVDTPATISDVLRLAIVVGLTEAEEMSPVERARAYAHIRAGLPLSA
jgi:hypothetical protein